MSQGGLGSSALFSSTVLSTCGCCAGLSAATPVEVFNRPGLSAVQYRTGTHALLKSTMLARLSASEHPALQPLRARSDDDFAIALLDSWAVVLDILTFYQERIANESYLRTATERRSLLEQSRLIGYEPRPGVAASTYLAFTVDNPAPPPTPGLAVPATATVPSEVIIETGTKVQSIPGPGEQAQMFETIEPIVAHFSWNAITPRLTQPHPLNKDLESVTIPGLSSFVKPGDALLVVAGDALEDRSVKRVLKTGTDLTRQVTQCDLVPAPKPVPLPPSKTSPAHLSRGSPSSTINWSPPSWLWERAGIRTCSSGWRRLSSGRPWHWKRRSMYLRPNPCLRHKECSPFASERHSLAITRRNGTRCRRASGLARR